MSSPSPLITAATLANRDLTSLVILDARVGPAVETDFKSSHIIHAQKIDLERDLSGDTTTPSQGGRHPLPPVSVWATTLGKFGITPTSDVVIYDAHGGAKAAARAYWMLRSIGHSRVQVLSGGIQAAQQAGVAMTSGTPASPRICAPYPYASWKWPTINIQALAAQQGNRDTVLIDVRDETRYRGEHEPLDPIAGHIPGAQNVPLARNLDSQGAFKNPEALRAQYATLIDNRAPSDVIVSCGSGVTACHTLLALEVAGFGTCTLYVGSFSEWCRSGRPIKTAPRTSPP